MTNPTGSYKFNEGENVLLFDRKGRRYLQKLKPGHSFHTHIGKINHNDMIGQIEGSGIFSDKGNLLRIFKPTLSDFTLEMPRIATRTKLQEEVTSNLTHLSTSSSTSIIFTSNMGTNLLQTKLVNMI